MAARSESERAAGLRALINRLATYKVLTWSQSSNDPDLPSDRVPAQVKDANVVSSLDNNNGRHAVVLDIDHPAWLVASSTPGHFHLYIDVPGGIPKNQYMDLLNTLSACGVIESGYARASMQRGHSAVRLPWIKKKKEKAS
jgi:hypothetical protein